MILSYRFRLLPTKGQHQRLRDALEHSRNLYNAGLAERIDCYRKTGKGRNFYDQTKALTQWRQECGSPYAWYMEAAPLKALDLAYKAFFKRGGFPRFKGKEWFKSIGWTGAEGWRVRAGRFYAKGIGAIRLHLHRPLPASPKTARVKREGRHWYLTVTCDVECAPANDSPAVGIDMGLSALAALSTGEMIPNERPYKRAMRQLRVRQRALARCGRNSKRRQKVRAKLAATNHTIRRSRDAYLHAVSANLTKRFGVIAVEKLNVKGLAAGMLAQSVNDASWGKLINFLRYKAAKAGGEVVEVDARGTSQTCPECGQVKVKALSERTHSCDCGCVLDRDVAAAKVVLLRAGVHARGSANVGGYAERSTGKAAA